MRGISGRRVEGGEDVRASRCACNVLFLLINPRYDARDSSTDVPSKSAQIGSVLSYTISFEVSVDERKKVWRRKNRHHLCEQATVILVTHHTHPDKGSSVFVEGGSMRGISGLSRQCQTDTLQQ